MGFTRRAKVDAANPPEDWIAVANLAESPG